MIENAFKNTYTRRVLPLVGASVLFVVSLLAVHAGVVAQLESAEGPTIEAPLMFETSAICLGCHNGLTALSGQEVSIGSDWRGSMMANAARDPYWQAAVRREIMDHPAAAVAIENECSTCHMPMAHYRAQVSGQTAGVFNHTPILPSESIVERDDWLAADGVGCAVCHQIAPDGFGTRESFVGGFVIDSTTLWEERQIYGPFDVDRGRNRIMQSASAFLPAAGSHISESALCATCHTLITHALDENDEIVGELPEQVPYLEWLHSGYANEKSCQSCHMPIATDSTAVTSVLGTPRADMNRHVFRGGNFLIPRLLNRHRADLGVEALPGELQATAARSAANLQDRAARIEIENVKPSHSGLEIDVLVQNLAGHKLPTAYPSRRVWIHLKVQDADDRLVFESGKPLGSGAIEGNDNDENSDTFERHYETIASVDQVQIYEAILGDTKGGVTTGLTTALTYLKDNRVLPRGFDKSTASEDIAVHGAAIEDVNFGAATDRTRYVVPVDSPTGAFTIEATLWYQPIGYRWAENLRVYNSGETNRFVAYYQEVSGQSAVVLAADEKEI